MLPEALQLYLRDALLCRKVQVQQIATLLDPDIPGPSILVLYGLEATGKSLTTKKVLAGLGCAHAVVNSRECITGRYLLERTLLVCKAAVQEGGSQEDFSDIDGRCENISALVVQLQRLLGRSKRFVLVFDGIDEQREAPQTLVPALARLGELISSLSVVMIVTAPRPGFLHLAGAPHIHFPPYDRAECLAIVCESPPDIYTQVAIAAFGERDNPVDREEDNHWLWSRFCGAVWDSLAKGAARDIVSFRNVCERLWVPFVTPIRSEEYGTRDFSRLMVRNRALFQSEAALAESLTAPVTLDAAAFEGRRKKTSSAHEFPYYTKYLIIASYLASHNPARQDQTFFMKAHERKRRKRGGGAAMGRMSKHRKIQRKLLGPQPFVLERMLAIFYAILPHDVNAGSADILTQISSLAALRLLVKASAASDPMDASAKWRVHVEWEYVQGLARALKFNVEDYVAE